MQYWLNVNTSSCYLCTESHQQILIQKWAVGWGGGVLGLYQIKHPN